MANTQNKHRKTWTPTDVAALQKLVTGNTPTRVIGFKLGRTEVAVQSKVKKLKVSLKPNNQSPYNRIKSKP